MPMFTSPRNARNGIIAILLFIIIFGAVQTVMTYKANAAGYDPYKAFIATARSGASKVMLVNDSAEKIGFEIRNGDKSQTVMVGEYNDKNIVINSKPGTVIVVNGPADGGQITSSTVPPLDTAVRANLQIDRDSRQATAALGNDWPVMMRVRIDAILPSGKNNVRLLAKYRLQPGQHNVVDVNTTGLPKGTVLRTTSGVNLDFIKVG